MVIRLLSTRLIKLNANKKNDEECSSMTKDDWGCSSMAEDVLGQLSRPSRECYLLNSDRTIKGLLTPSSYHKRVKDAKSRAIEQITVCDATFLR